MNRAQRTRLARGLAASLGLLALVAGLPAILAVVVGWPLPHGLPSLSAIRDGLAHGWSPGGQVVVKALAVVCWGAWAEITACAAVETVGALRGRSAARVPMAGALQPVVARLVAAAFVALSSMGSPGAPARPSSLAAAVAGYQLERPRLNLVAATEASPPPAPAQPLPASGRPTVKEIVVRPRDDLWDLAEAYLGDPFRWREIWELNAGRLQPDGQRFVEPQLIRPGWVLQLPPDAVGVEAGPATTPLSSPAATGAADGPMPAPAPPTPAVPGSSPSQPVQAPSPGGSAGVSEPLPSARSPAGPHRQVGAGPGSLELPSGSVVGISLAAGIAAAVATVRLRLRRAYRPSAPQLATGKALPDLGPTTREVLAALRKKRAGDGDDAHSMKGDEAPFIFAGLDDPRPGAVVIGERAGDPVELDTTGVAGLDLDGSGADDVARCLVASLLTKGGAHVVHVLIPHDTAARLLPGVACFPGLNVARDSEDGLREAEVQLVRRARLLDEEGVADFATHRLRFPDDPLPAFILVADDLPEGRMGAVASLGARLGVGVVNLGPASQGTSHLHLMVGAGGEVLECVSSGSDAEFAGIALHRLSVSEAVELVGVLAAGRSDAVQPAPAEETEGPGEPAIDWEGLGTAPAGVVVRVQLLGPCRIEVDAEEIKGGLRGSARDLLAYFLLHPEGASVEAAADALWPEADLARGQERFWTALGNLRSRLREATGGTEKLVERHGDLYRVEAGVLNVDVWRCQAALAEARKSPDDESACSALVRAAVEYGGDLLEGSYSEWVEPIRQSLRRQVLDALALLAELQAREGNLNQALAALEQAIKIDPYAEELYRREMRLLAQLGRADAARRLLRQLEARLSDLDAEPEGETLRLAEAIGL